MIQFLIDKELAEYIVNHFRDHLREEELLRTDSGSLSRKYRYSKIIDRFNEGILADSAMKVLAHRTAKRRSS